MLTNTHYFYLPEPLSFLPNLRIQFTNIRLIIKLISLSRSPTYLLLIRKMLIQNRHDLMDTAVCVA